MFIRRRYKGEISMFGPGSEKRRKKSTGTKIFWFFVLVALVVVFVFFVKKEDKNSGEESLSPQEVERLTQELSRFMVVPSEEPLVFKISDSDYLKGEQKFFENSSNDDVLFVFPETQKAVLYNPKTEKIINAGPVNFNTEIVK